MDETKIEEIEEAIMEKLLFGEHPILEILRQQFKVAKICEREFTGIGFFSKFSLPENILKVDKPKNFTLRDVNAEISNIHCGFILYIRNGLIDCLECHTWHDNWPLFPQLQQIYYFQSSNSNFLHNAQPNNRDFLLLDKELQLSIDREET